MVASVISIAIGVGTASAADRSTAWI